MVSLPLVTDLLKLFGPVEATGIYRADPFPGELL